MNRYLKTTLYFIEIICTFYNERSTVLFLTYYKKDIVCFFNILFCYICLCNMHNSRMITKQHILYNIFIHIYIYIYTNYTNYLK